MKKLLLYLSLCVFTTITPAPAAVLEAGVSIEDVPKALFGQWRISSKLDTTNAPKTFRPQSIDFWNLLRVGNTLKLDNPFSGANAELNLENVEGNIVVFSKKLPYDGNKVLTDTVTIRLNQNELSGINTLKLEYFSLIDNHLMKTETATYHIKGEKISGDSVVQSIEEAVPPSEE